MMTEPIYIHRYQQVSRHGLNSRSDRTVHEGVLIRIGNGVGCLHPWRELGDPSLEELLEDLRLRRFFRPLIRAAVKCAMVDGNAREQGINVFDGLEVPRSHATLVGGLSEIELACKRGFEVVKMKAGRQPEAEVTLLNDAHRAHPELRWRLDFNHALSSAAVLRFIEGLSPSLREQIDFLEDPCDPRERGWADVRKNYGICLAVDRDVPMAHGQHYRYAVVKPALDDVTAICAQAMLEAWKLVFTSYMDHPIGQCFAAWSAGKAQKRFPSLVDSVAGLMTHGLFEATAFTERLGEPGPEWQSPGGTGFGFDDLIEQLDWKKLD